MRDLDPAAEVSAKDLMPLAVRTVIFRAGDAAVALAGAGAVVSGLDAGVRHSDFVCRGWIWGGRLTDTSV